MTKVHPAVGGANFSCDINGDDTPWQVRIQDFEMGGEVL